MNKTILSFLTLLLSCAAFAQPTHVITDEEKEYKTVREFIAKEQYAFAYTLLKELRFKYAGNKKTDHAYIDEDINYYTAICELKLMQDIGRADGLEYIRTVSNEPRRQLISFHLAHYYFLKNDYEKAISNFNNAGYDNLSNEQIADAKFEKAYAHFNLKQFSASKSLFNEIHQLPGNKYYIPANYYYGFISYYDKDYNEALTAFRLVETFEEYKAVVPYYIAEIYYFRGMKADALRYADSVLSRNTPLYYDKQLRLLTGQIYFEQKEYNKALPLLEAYVSDADKVSKEILYELSFCYYIAGNNAKAIEGFKQLSNERDSMGQNSMYLLGDLYLKTGEKENARTAFQYSAFNNSNAFQQKVSRFNFAKLSYELGYSDAALREIKDYLKAYPNSEYDSEAKEIAVALMAKSSDFTGALAMYRSLETPTAAMKKIYPSILYGKGIEYVNDGELTKADELFTKVITDPNAGTRAAYANFWRGEIAYRQQRYDDAVRFHSLFLQSNMPAQGEANMQAAKYTIGYSRFQQESYVLAAGFFEQVAKTVSAGSPPLEHDAFLRSADAYYMQRDFTKAAAMYNAAVAASSPQSDYAIYQKGMIAGIKNSADKIRLLNSVVVGYPNTSLRQDINMETALTYIADEKFTEAVPYLNAVLASDEGGLKPRAYLKLGLAYYNSNHNAEALKTYTQLIKTYPQSAEASDATDIIKNIYVEEGRPDDYVAFMKQNGRAVSMSEADSLSYSSAFNKYQSGDCTAAISSFINYTDKYPNGSFIADANYMRSDCYLKNKDFLNALNGFAFVSSLGSGKYFEKATLEAAQIAYLELKDYHNAKKHFESLRAGAVNRNIRLEALRGLVRSYYQLKDYSGASSASAELLAEKGISTDDRSVGALVLGKSRQLAGDCTAAIVSFKAVAAINRSAWGAEARYAIADCYYAQNNFKASEKAALSVIKETGSYDEWVTRSYILLGDIFVQQKDWFNAKATYESVVKNAILPALKIEAQQKLDLAISAEKSQSKISN